MKIVKFEEYFSKQHIAIIKQILHLSLEEDIGTGDITTRSTIPLKAKATARLIAKQKGILCGTALIPLIFAQKTKKAVIKIKIKDGSQVKPGDIVAVIECPAVDLLEVERVCLNYIQRLSGIATFTRKFVDQVAPYPCKIMDTRKTTPLLRMLEKYAVYVGGGTNHRFALYDQILIKDNHIDVAGGIEAAIKRVRHKYPGRLIQVEARTMDEFKRALPFRPEIVLLDNMTPAQLKKAVDFAQGKVLLEASGGVNLENVRKIAATGVHRISIGALTHSAPALDLSLKIHIPR